MPKVSAYILVLLLYGEELRKLYLRSPVLRRMNFDSGEAVEVEYKGRALIRDVEKEKQRTMSARAT